MASRSPSVSSASNDEWSRVVFWKNASKDVSLSDIILHFHEISDSVEVKRDVNADGTCPTLIKFDCAEAAEEAVWLLSGSNLNGHAVELEMADPEVVGSLFAFEEQEPSKSEAAVKEEITAPSSNGEIEGTIRADATKSTEKEEECSGNVSSTSAHLVRQTLASVMELTSEFRRDYETYRVRINEAMNHESRVRSSIERVRFDAVVLNLLIRTIEAVKELGDATKCSVDYSSAPAISLKSFPGLSLIQRLPAKGAGESDDISLPAVSNPVLPMQYTTPPPPITHRNIMSTNAVNVTPMAHVARIGPPRIPSSFPVPPPTSMPPPMSFARLGVSFLPEAGTTRLGSASTVLGSKPPNVPQAANAPKHDVGAAKNLMKQLLLSLKQESTTTDGPKVSDKAVIDVILPHIHQFGLTDLGTFVGQLCQTELGAGYVLQQLSASKASSSNDVHTRKVDMVVGELVSKFTELARDSFAATVIVNLCDMANTDQIYRMACKMIGSMESLAYSYYGCKVVSKLLTMTTKDITHSLVAELKGKFLNLLRDIVARQVIKTILEQVDSECFDEIYDDVLHDPRSFALVQNTNWFCDNLFARGEPERVGEVIEKLLSSTEELMAHPIGNYAIRSIVKFGKEEHRQEVVVKVLGNVTKYCKDKIVSNVIQACLKHGTNEERYVIIEEFLGDALGSTEGEEMEQAAEVISVLTHQYGNYVVQEMIELACTKQRQVLLALIIPFMDRLQQNVYGSHVVAKVSKYMGDIGSELDAVANAEDDAAAQIKAEGEPSAKRQRNR